MGELVLSLIPLAIGVVLSPLAIMALVAVLLSHNARRNGVAFLLGWIVAILLVLGVSFWIFTALEVKEPGLPPVWVPVLRLIIGLVMVAAAVAVYRRGHAKVLEMAAAATPADVVKAAPQLPGWLTAVETFTPVRSFLLGLGIFILNPVDASCAVLAALDIRLAGLTTGSTVTVLIVFAVIGILPIAIPVLFALVRGAAAQPLLDQTRSWIAGHTSVLNAALLLVIAVLQLQKALSAFLSY